MHTVLAYSIFIVFIVIGFFISYKSSVYMINKTNIFGTNLFLGIMINVLQGGVAIYSWFFYSWFISESMFFNGLILGLWLTISSAIILTVWLVLKQEQYRTAFLSLLNKTKDYSFKQLQKIPLDEMKKVISKRVRFLVKR